MNKTDNLRRARRPADRFDRPWGAGVRRHHDHVGAGQRNQCRRAPGRSLEFHPPRQDRADHHPRQPDGHQARDRRPGRRGPGSRVLRPHLHARFHEGRLPHRPHRRPEGRPELRLRRARPTRISPPTRARSTARASRRTSRSSSGTRTCSRRPGSIPTSRRARSAKSKRTRRRSARSAADIYGFYFSGSCPGCNIFTTSPMMVAAGSKILPANGNDEALTGEGVKEVLEQFKEMWNEGLDPEKRPGRQRREFHRDVQDRARSASRAPAASCSPNSSGTRRTWISASRSCPA